MGSTERVISIDLDANTDEEMSTDGEDDETGDEVMTRDGSDINTSGNSLNDIFQNVVNDFVTKMETNSDEEIEFIEDIKPSNVSQPNSQCSSQSDTKDSQTYGEGSGLSVCARGQTTERSTHTRFTTTTPVLCVTPRAFDYSRIDRRTGLVMSDKQTICLNSSKENNNWKQIYLCCYCLNKLEEKKKLMSHLKSDHKNRAKIYVKYRGIIETNINKSHNSQQNSAHSSSPFQRPLPMTSIPKKSRPNESVLNRTNNENQSKSQTNESENKRIRLNDQYLADSDSTSGNKMTRVLYRCKLCQFIPIINPTDSMYEHLRKEHNSMIKNDKMDNFYEPVRVRVRPRANKDIVSVIQT